MVQSARKMHPQIFDAKPGNNQWEVNKQATTTTTTTTKKQERKGKRADFFDFLSVLRQYIQAYVLLYFTVINTALT